MKLLDGVTADARFSDDGVYRYTLTREWAQTDKGQVGWIMLNPSTATAADDDRTIRRCQSFAKDWGYSGITVANLFALRATNPKALRSHADPVGPDNDETLRSLAEYDSDLIVFAWGANKAVRSRGLIVEELVAAEGRTSHCLRRTKEGRPEHPLYVHGEVQPEVWREP